MKRIILSLILSVMALVLPSVAQASNSTVTVYNALADWISVETKGKVSTADARNYAHEAFRAGKRWDVDPLLILAVMKPESNYNAKAKNRSGASGLMQVIPRWHKDKIKGRNIMHYQVNIDVGAQVINEYLAWHKESYHKALSRYNGGARNIYGQKVQKTYRELRDAVWGWRMSTDMPLAYEHKFGYPRHFGYTYAAYQIFEDDRNRMIVKAPPVQKHQRPVMIDGNAVAVWPGTRKPSTMPKDEKPFEALIAQQSKLQTAYNHVYQRSE